MRRLNSFYWLLFFINDTWNTRQSFHPFSLFRIFFLPSFSFLSYLFKLSVTKKHHVCNLFCTPYSLSFCYVIYYTVLEIYIGGCFLEDCFYCYSKQITVYLLWPINLLFPTTLQKKHQKHRILNTVTLNANPNQIKKR